MPNWWPFGRRKRKQKKEQARDVETATLEKEPTATTTEQHSEPYTLVRQPLSEKSVVSPPQPVPREPIPRESAENITALPTDNRRAESPHLFSSPDRPASLHSKRSATYESGSARRKSSRKSQNDRESKIRSMTAPIPVPKMPAGGRRMRDDINSSVVSLPHAPSVRSSVTGFSDNHYDVGAIDVFSPRPTIRYSTHSPMASGAIRSAVTSRTEHRREEEESPRHVLRESRTIDDLADRYDTMTVRELMERDAKRRERRKKAEEDKARRRLERHAARERGEAGPSSRSKRRARSPRTEMAEHRKREREAGLGLSGVEAAGTTPPKSPAREKSPRGQEPRAQEEQAVKETEDLSKQNPFNDPGSEVTTPADEPVVETAEAIRYSTASMSPPGSPRGHERKTSNISQITDLQVGSATNLGEPASDRRASETSNRRGGPLAALLRRNAPTGRGSGEKTRSAAFEPSFSNTSRESMKGQLPPAHLRDTRHPPSRSNTPTRTMSKFKEDLPEYSRTTPDLKAEPPAEPPIPPISALQRSKLPDSPLQKTSTPQEEATARNDSMGSTKMLSQSLASVDSEGSWLSGRPAKRSSQQMTPQMLSERSEFRGSYENLAITDEEYFRRQATSEPRAGLSAIQTALRGDSGKGQTAAGRGEGEEQVIRGDVSRRPTVIQQEGRKQSSEGLLNQFKEGEAATIEEDSKPTSPTSAGTEGSPIEEPEIKPVLGHARSISRGSAKLLDIPSRRSTPQVSPQLKQGEFDEPTEEKSET